jgi:hypothetical protein
LNLRTLLYLVNAPPSDPLHEITQIPFGLTTNETKAYYMQQFYNNIDALKLF